MNNSKFLGTLNETDLKNIKDNVQTLISTNQDRQEHYKQFITLLNYIHYYAPNEIVQFLCLKCGFFVNREITRDLLYPCSKCHLDACCSCHKNWPIYYIYESHVGIPIIEKIQQSTQSSQNQTYAESEYATICTLCIPNVYGKLAFKDDASEDFKNWELRALDYKVFSKYSRFYLRHSKTQTHALIYDGTVYMDTDFRFYNGKTAVPSVPISSVRDFIMGKKVPAIFNILRHSNLGTYYINYRVTIKSGIVNVHIKLPNVQVHD